MRATLFVSLLVGVSGCYAPSIPNGSTTQGFSCMPTDNPACPEGFSCVNQLCVKPTGASTDGGISPITKACSYNGAKMNPKLDALTDCKDYDTNPTMSLEPNDSTSTASPISFSVTPDQATPKLINLAICPMGINPKASAHDVDYYKVDLSTFSTVKSLVANVTYQVTYGDVDIAILDSNGTQLGSDGTCVDNGCASAAVSSGIFYVLVVGANSTDVNNYQLSIRSYSTSKGCDGTTVGDGGTVIHDLSGGGNCKAQAALCQTSDECCSQSCTFGTCN